MIYWFVIKRLKTLSLAIALKTNLRSQFNHVFALLISMYRFHSINFCLNSPKSKLFLQKRAKKTTNL